ncbi:MAG: PorV/PorQ family protein, partial [Bacteroidales bacterium]|nr:PorV/PorQ family protein [Bacteroidales bacterium]
MKVKLKIKILLFFLILHFSKNVFSQSINKNQLAGQINPITTAFPFLTIAPDARAGAMGDAGVSSSPDINSNHWNPSKFAFIEKDIGFGISYTPWLRALVPDINLAYIGGYKKLDKSQTISASLLYFSLGDLIFTNMFGNIVGQKRPSELALDFAYSRKLGMNISGGVA